jgi:hypothetical protein
MTQHNTYAHVHNEKKYASAVRKFENERSSEIIHTCEQTEILIESVWRLVKHRTHVFTARYLVKIMTLPFFTHKYHKENTETLLDS